MNLFSEMKKQPRIQNRHKNKQQLKVKAILRIGATSIVLIVIGFVMFFNFSSTEKSKASEETKKTSFILVQDQEFITDMNISQPVVIRELPDANTFQFRKLKTEESDFKK